MFCLGFDAGMMWSFRDFVCLIFFDVKAIPLVGNRLKTIMIMNNTLRFYVTYPLIARHGLSFWLPSTVSCHLPVPLRGAETGVHWLRRSRMLPHPFVETVVSYNHVLFFNCSSARFCVFSSACVYVLLCVPL